MDGQIACAGGLHLDLRSMNQLVWLDVPAKAVRVQAGMRWRDLQEILDPAGLAVMTMQSYANFTVGGSVSVNAHGRCVGNGPLGHSVRALQLVLADGAVIEASRAQNAQIFRAAIGGYGAVGVICEVELDLALNVPLERIVTPVALDEYPDYFKTVVRSDPDCILHNADPLPQLFTAPLAISWRATSRCARVLPFPERFNMRAASQYAFMNSRAVSGMTRKFWLQTIFYIAAFVALFLNFSYLVGILLQLLGQIYLSARSLLTVHAAPLEWSQVILPFEGRWKVLNGGVYKSLSHSWSLLSQRYAYDFLIEAQQEKPLSDIKYAHDYPAWGCPLCAPGSGVIVRIKDGLKDHAVGSLFLQFITLRSLLGNHVVIRLESIPAFVLLAHLQQGSCIHRVGDKVRIGDYIGRCGNSGLSTKPHLHLQVQDGANFFFAKGLPIAFKSVLVERNCTEHQYQFAVIQRGDFVESIKTKPDAEKQRLQEELPEIAEPYPGTIFISALVTLTAVMIAVVSFYHMLIFQWIVR